ncbi:MAG: NAD-dependent dehydratase [Thaumarchaeota archaeon]|jgi:UDP-glucose 4-epimerase|nr:MAG: NAD-dependent dehydratase [Nitrososphaerota archaeon]
MMNILVTGGAGFIGRHLVKFLIENKKNVSILDNFSNSDRKLIPQFEKDQIKVFEGDIRNDDDVSRASKDQDVVIHLAAKISVEESIKNPTETFEINVEGTKNLLKICKKNNVEKIIAASSAAVYGEGDGINKITEQTKMNPISPYGESKVKMEKEIIKFCSDNQINYVILRFFNIYGLGQSIEYAGVITKFLEKIQKNENLKIFGDGLQTRDFVAIEDIINSIYNAIEYTENVIFNIASGRKITIKALAELMISLSNKKLNIEYGDIKKGDIMHSEADIQLAKENLNYNNKIDLKYGVQQFLDLN